MYREDFFVQKKTVLKKHRPVSYTHLDVYKRQHLLETKAADEKTSGYGEAALREIPYF